MRAFGSPFAVLSPTRELAEQTQKVVLAIGEYMSVKCHACIGGKSIGEDIRRLEVRSVADFNTGRRLCSFPLCFGMKCYMLERMQCWRGVAVCVLRDMATMGWCCSSHRCASVMPWSSELSRCSHCAYWL